MRKYRNHFIAVVAVGVILGGVYSLYPNQNKSLAQDQVIFEQPFHNRKYSSFPDSGNIAFAQTFILSNGGLVTAVEMPIRTQTRAILNFYAVSSTSIPPNYPSATPIASYVIPGGFEDFTNFVRVLDISNNPLPLQANTPYAMLITGDPTQNGATVDFTAWDPPDDIDVYPGQTHAS